MVLFRWRPGISDPTFVGWLTVAAYATAACLAASAFASARRAESASVLTSRMLLATNVP